MTKHRHCEMIKAKADNMELAVLCKDSYDQANKWQETSQLPIQEEFDYFLCLPQHKDTCLHWLGGGEIEINATFEDDEWIGYYPVESWSAGSVFMQCDHGLRAKPRKEKLWIAVKTDRHENIGGCRKVRICSHAFVNKQDAVDYLDLDSAQLIEIEIEV